METVYVVQGFQSVRGAVLADKPLIHGFESLALNHGAELATHRLGVVVYSQQADTDRGRYSEPVILTSHGETRGLVQEGLVSYG